MYYEFHQNHIMYILIEKTTIKTGLMAGTTRFVHVRDRPHLNISGLDRDVFALWYDCDSGISALEARSHDDSTLTISLVFNGVTYTIDYIHEPVSHDNSYPLFVYSSRNIFDDEDGEEQYGNEHTFFIVFGDTIETIVFTINDSDILFESGRSKKHNIFGSELINHFEINFTSQGGHLNFFAMSSSYFCVGSFHFSPLSNTSERARFDTHNLIFFQFGVQSIQFEECSISHELPLICVVAKFENGPSFIFRIVMNGADVDDRDDDDNRYHRIISCYRRVRRSYDPQFAIVSPEYVGENECVGKISSSLSEFLETIKRSNSEPLESPPPSPRFNLDGC